MQNLSLLSKGSGKKEVKTKVVGKNANRRRSEAKALYFTTNCSPQEILKMS